MLSEEEFIALAKEIKEKIKNLQPWQAERMLQMVKILYDEKYMNENSII